MHGYLGTRQRVGRVLTSFVRISQAVQALGRQEYFR